MNLDGKNSLHIASQMGHLEEVERLLQDGVPVDSLKRGDWFVSFSCFDCPSDNISIGLH